MLAAPFLPTAATHRPLSRARLLTTCKLSLLLLCAFCCTCCFAAPALAQSAARAASSSSGSDTGFTYQVPEIGPPILGSKAHAATATASQPQPDVQALDVTWAPANPQSGDLVKFKALVTNLGMPPPPNTPSSSTSRTKPAKSPTGPAIGTPSRSTPASPAG